MSEYKYPISRKEVWVTITEILENILVEKIGRTDSCESNFNEMADEISGNYNSYIENDGDSDKKATRKCKEEFFEMLQNIRDEIVGQFDSDMQVLFED